MGDHDWMLWSHKPPLPSRSARQEVPGFVYVKDGRVMTGVTAAVRRDALGSRLQGQRRAVSG
jgi:hypothetical protein